MISASPHRYRAAGQALGRNEGLLRAALAQAIVVERRGVPSILTLRHLAHRIEVDYRFLRSVVADASGSFYRDFQISKRNGGIRRIVVPEPRLKAVQRWIVREILVSQQVHPNSFAYARKSSIKACAERHVGAGWLIKLDIHDFFESIAESRVYQVFRDIGYQPLVSFELARLCTRVWVAPAPNVDDARRIPNAAKRGIVAYTRRYTGYLPQGAPTSPMLSNLVCRGLDSDLAAMADALGLTVTRYSDDLTFSAPAAGLDRTRVAVLIGEVRATLLRHGFRLHEKKTSISPPGSRKLVLGLLVDRDRPRLSRDMRSRIADHVRGIEKFGLTAHAKARSFDAISGMVAHIEGLLRFAAHIDPNFTQHLSERLEAALKSQRWVS